jgi:aryl-alcohol dehydrogenase-like predicted oxidoreductase
VLLATKVGMPRGKAEPGTWHRREHIVASCERSLASLQTDHIDLYQLHQPDPKVPIADTLAALDELVRDGLVREIGCSNFTANQLAEAASAVADGAARFVSVQNELSLLETSDLADGLAGATAVGLAYIPYYPLASGVLTGKYRRGEKPAAGTRLAAYNETPSDDEFDRVDALRAFAAEKDRSLLELAIGWLASLDPVASVITGATKPEQIQSNAEAATWRLTGEELAEVELLLA